MLFARTAPYNSKTSNTMKDLICFQVFKGLEFSRWNSNIFKDFSSKYNAMVLKSTQNVVFCLIEEDTYTGTNGEEKIKRQPANPGWPGKPAETASNSRNAAPRCLIFEPLQDHQLSQVHLINSIEIVLHVCDKAGQTIIQWIRLTGYQGNSTEFTSSSKSTPYLLTFLWHSVVRVGWQDVQAVLIHCHVQPKTTQTKQFHCIMCIQHNRTTFTSGCRYCGNGVSWKIGKSFVPRSRQITMPAPHHKKTKTIWNS